jgi:hypothetical protein
MSMKKINIKELIQEYLLDEGLLREKLPDPNSSLDFGYAFSFPSSQKVQNMSVLKPKNKDFIVIIIRTQLSKQHITALNSLKDNKKKLFFEDLRKFFIIKEVSFRIDPQNYRYEISNQIFLKKDGSISKNSFFKNIKQLFYCFMYGNLTLNNYCSGKIKPSTEPASGFDFSLYT